MLIIKREYLTRVRKKMFILTTLMLPLLYAGLIFATGYISKHSRKVLQVAVVDESGYFTPALLDKHNALDPSSVLKSGKISDTINYDEAGYDAYIVIPPFDWKTGHRFQLKARKSIGTSSTSLVESKLNRAWDDIKNERLGIDTSTSRVIATSRIGLRSENIDDPKTDAATASGLGNVFGFLIYFIILIYGSQVMMGVMEEKTNRIAEIIVSSVKPFQMMLGKILGIALVALTQFFLWILFIFIIYNVTKSTGSAANNIIGSVEQVFNSINIPLVTFLFIFYFLGGFFFYASIYGAIGSAISEDIREAQALSFPVTMLVIISIFLMMTTADDPTGPIAVWGSLIPFSSPIIMMSRIPYGVPGTVPWWQLGLSMVLLIGGFILTTWFAGKIYRTGILMYGKKATWKELIKWAFRKN
jgi:ABC-2 type transport system permease protein